ncbi:PREDICTED: uncharacterized protein LOC109472450 isoform X2 [Branchiostoma belcheri]|uniref:Integral membrane protein 2 n=1 Tax=Branchiostoma belcheri TaxID=7741 RepID=A0A6P4Z9N9_BRABE|nr:PREDICTED: uncharacterized protein LOC109472450 isoform X2 [Branchiostoma belcheri]
MASKEAICEVALLDPPAYERGSKSSEKTKWVITALTVVLVTGLIVGGLLASAHLWNNRTSDTPHKGSDSGRQVYVRVYEVDGRRVSEQITVDQENQVETFHVPQNGQYQAVTVRKDFKRNLAVYKDDDDRVCFVRTMDNPREFTPDILDKMLTTTKGEVAEESAEDDVPAEQLSVLEAVPDLGSLAGADAADLCTGYSVLRVGPAQDAAPAEGHQRVRRQYRDGFTWLPPTYTWGGGRHSISGTANPFAGSAGVTYTFRF